MKSTDRNIDIKLHDEVESLRCKVKNLEKELENIQFLKTKEEEVFDIYKNLPVLFPVVIYIFKLDPQGNFSIEFINKEAVDLLGIPEHEICKADVFDNHIFPEDLPGFYESIKKSATQLTPWHYEFRVVINEEKRWFEGKSIPRIDEDNNIIWNGVLLEVTLRKNKEHELISAKEKSENNERKLNELFQNMNEAFALHKIILDEEGQPTDYIFIDVNPYFEKITGLKKENILNQRVRKVLPDFDSKWLDIYGDVALNGNAKEFSSYSVEIQKHYNIKCYSPEKGYFATVFSDITDLVISKNELTLAKERAENNEKIYHGLFESLPIGLCLSDQNGNILETNPVFKKLFDSFSEAIPCKSLFEEKDKIKNKEIEIKDKTGKSTWLQLSITPLDINGLGAVISFNDITKKVEYEELILAEKNKLKQYLNIAGILFIALDRNGMVKMANKKACEILEISEEEMLGKYWFNFIPERNRKEVERMFEQIINGKVEQLEFVENKIISRTGKVKEVYWRNSLIKDAFGNIEGTLSAGEDITEKKAIKKALEKSEFRYKSLFENMSNGFAFHELLYDGKGSPVDYIFLEANPAFEKLTGLKVNDIIGKKASDVFQNFDRKWLDIYERVAKTGRAQSFSGYIEHIDQYFDSWSFSITPGTCATIFTNTTEQVRSKEEIVRHNERLKSLVKITQFRKKNVQELLDLALHEALELTNSKLGFLYFYNEGEEKFTLNSWSKTTMKECQMLEKKKIFYLQDIGCWADAVRLRKPVIMNNYDAYDGKKGLPEGHVKIEKYLSIPVFESDEIVAVLGVGNKAENYDESDIMQLNLLMGNVWKSVIKQKNHEELLRAKEKAEESDKLKTAFLQNMSHEIRTPMNSIMGFSSLLAKAENDKSKRELYIRTIRKSGKQLLSVVDDILDISLIETGKLKLNFELENLNETIKDIRNIFAKKAALKGLEVKTTKGLPDSECNIVTDKYRLRQVLINLMSNAIKFTRKGHIKFGYEKVNDEFRFFVEDTGIGIDKSMEKKIFERFRQIEINISRQYGGTGLGLSISEKLVDMLGGKIWLKSELDVGSTFYFTISDKNDEIINKFQEAETIRELVPDNKYKILIAEDEQINFFYLEEVLSELNVEIIRAVNGVEAVDLFAKNQDVDLILLDIKMPKMDGYQAVKLIKGINPDVPVIAQTAYAMKTDRQKSLDTGFDEYISKPIKEADLLKKIKKFLRS